MSIASIADYLVNQVVKTASSLQQQSRDTSSQGIVRPQRDNKMVQREVETDRAVRSSSAYRVTISSDAMQKMAMSGASR